MEVQLCRLCNKGMRYEIIVVTGRCATRDGEEVKMLETPPRRLLT